MKWAGRLAKEGRDVAEYDLSGVWMNGEHLIVQDAHLSTREGLEAPAWNVVIDGAHILHQDTNERVDLRMATSDGHEVEGEARVTFAGDHDESTKIYYGVRLEGLSTLHQLR